NGSGGVRYEADVVEAPAESQAWYRAAADAAAENPTRETIQQRLERLMVTPDRVTDELVEIRYRFYSDPEGQKAQQFLLRASRQVTDRQAVGTMQHAS